MFSDMLLLTGVQVARVTRTPDGQGGASVTTVLTTLPRAALWGLKSGKGYFSEKITPNATHELATVPADYSFNSHDEYVVYEGSSYKIISPPNDVMNMGEIMSVTLELQI